MLEQLPQYVLYLRFRRKDGTDSTISDIAFSTNREELKELGPAPADSDELDGSGDSKNTEPDVRQQEPGTPTQQLARLMTTFQESVSSFQTLIFVSTAMMPALKARAMEQMFKVAQNDYALLEENGECKLFGITDKNYRNVRNQFRELKEMDQAEIVFPSAILLSLVATFDSFIGDTIRILLKSRSDRWSQSDKTITLQDLLSMTSFEQAIDSVVEKEVEAVMRGGHDDQIKFIEKELNIKIRDFYDEWGSFIEIFERRNLTAHGNCIVNKRYLENCKRHQYNVENIKLGTTLTINAKYLRRSAARLLEFGLVLAFVLWRKHFPNSEEDAYKHLNNAAYDLIRNKNPMVAARILEFALFKQSPKVQDYLHKMMTVNLANAFKKIKKEDRSKEVIETVDWSASGDEFQICIAALQGSVERFVDLMPRFAERNDEPKMAFREWPVFDWVRNEDRVRQKFLELFGEPLIEQTEQETKRVDPPTEQVEQETKIVE